MNKNYFIRTFLFIVSVSVLTELLFSGTTIFKFGWLSSPVSFIYIITLVSLTYLLALSASNSTNIARVGVISVLLVLSLISKIKFYYRASPLFYSDLSLFKELNDISSNINYSFAINSIILYLIISAALIYITLKFKKNHFTLSGNMRLLFSVISIFFILLLTKYDTLALSAIDCNSSCITGFVSSVPLSPEGSINLSDLNSELSWKIQTTTSGSTVVSTPEPPPNIIVIMSEAFLDITRDTPDLYTEDIYKNFNEIRNESRYGYFESPEFGGGTSNCEFEMLTGVSTHMFPSGKMIYEDSIKEAMPSLASILKQNGYSTVAIHPYEKWFWNRENVYPLLGFDEFISIDEMENPEYSGYYVSDQYAFNTIKEKIEATEEPVFTFLVTIQNHGPYNDNRYGDEALDINLAVDNNEKQILNTYGLGIKRSDEALGDLISYLKDSDENSVLLIFGDHLPMLDEKQRLYEALGFKEAPDTPDKMYRKMYSVPFILWEKNRYSQEYLGYKDMIFASPILLSILDMDMNDNFNLLLKKSEEINYINRNFLYTTDKKLFFTDEKEYKKINASFKLKKDA